MSTPASENNPDGQGIISGSWDQKAEVWDSATPTQVAAWQAEGNAAEQRLNNLRATQGRESQQP